MYRVFVGSDAEKTASAGRRLPYHARLVEDPTVDGDRDDLPRNELAALLQGRFGGVFQSAAAGDLHAHDGHALDIVMADDLVRRLDEALLRLPFSK